MVITDAFNAEFFRQQGYAAIDLLADYLQKVEKEPVLPFTHPDTMLKRWTAEFSQRRDPLALIQEVISGSNHLHHPHYVGHQVTSPLPMSALFSLVASLLNNGSAVYEMGSVSSAMERRCLQWMARRLGFGPHADGVLTSGGSAGNLTALLAARQAKAGYDAWKGGQDPSRPLAVLVSDQTHYCIKRAAQIMGWGEDGVVSIPTDAHYRMRTDELERIFQETQAKGQKVIAVVASACSTATGAIDPLLEIADFAERHNLWFHVDGAHGASFVLAPKMQDKLSGLERADSVVWDAHKMLLTPALITAVIFRNGKHSYESFAQKANYLFGDEKARQDNWYDIGMRTLECTKTMMGFVLYASLATYGEDYFAEYGQTMVDLGKTFAAMIDRSPDFELAVQPDANIVCFRYRTPELDAQDADALQERIRLKVVASGEFYLVQTKLRGTVFLRTTLINPATHAGHLQALLDALRRAARTADKSGH